MVNIFTRNITDSLTSLVKNIDKQVGEDKIKENKDDRLAAFVVYLTDDPDAAEKELKAFAEKHNIKNIPLTVFDGIAGPSEYKISKDADVTVMMWKKNKKNKVEVKVNYAFAEGKLNKKSVKEVASSTSKILE